MMTGLFDNYLKSAVGIMGLNTNTIPYILPLSITVLGSIITAYYIWRRGGSEAIISIVILLGGAEWVFAYIMEIVLNSLPAKVFWNQVQYIGGSIIVTGLLILALQSTGYDKWVTWRNVLLASIIPMFSLCLIFTNQYHGLFWPYHVLVARRGVLWLEHPHGPFYWLYVGYVQILMLVIILFLLWSVFHSPKQYRWQALMILSGTLLTFTVSILEPFGINILPPLNLVQMSFVMGIIPISLGLLRLQIGDIVPVARTAVFDGMDDGVLVVDARGKIIDMNTTAQQLFRVADEEAINQLVETVWMDGQAMEKISQPVARSWLKPSGHIYHPGEKSAAGREVILEKSGEKRIFDVRISPIVDWRSYIMSQVIVLRDITERVQAEEGLQQANEQLRHELAERERVEKQIQESLTEKEVLLKEIHHRVKNNLQVISSMLNLQTNYLTDEPSLAIFQDSQNRVRSMALIHEELYQSENLSWVNFGEYIENLAAYLFRSYDVHGVQLHVEAEEVHWGIDTAVPCGLILNELISNALKHAFPNGNSGQIAITLHTEADDQICLSVADDGVGLPPGLDIFNAPSLGLQLVHALASQLGGSLQIDQSSGVRFTISFPFHERVRQ